MSSRQFFINKPNRKQSVHYYNFKKIYYNKKGRWQHSWSIQVAAWSSTQVCGRLPDGITGSNPAGCNDVCVVCVVQQEQKTQKPGQPGHRSTDKSTDRKNNNNKISRDTALQDRRSQVRFHMGYLRFFTDLFLLTAFFPCGQLSL